ncbi:MAG: DUF5067 domain-containing protein [Ruminococcus sp.]|nr:DUF5067 domain-containing protein [Ruminococcus sp.]
MKIFKSTLALFMALLMVFALVGCSDKDPADNNTNKGAGGFKETEIVLDECKVVVVGAEQIVDYDEKPAVRLWYDITNTSEDSNYANWLFFVSATQDGYDLDETTADFEMTVEEEPNSYRKLRPGVTIRAVYEFVFKEDGGAISVNISNFEDEENATTISLDPKNLPGKPKSEFKLAKVDDPKWMGDIKSEGTYNSFGEVYEIKIEKFELTKNFSGEDLIRVYYDFKNTGSETTSFNMTFIAEAYQDGASLESGYPEEEVSEDQNGTVEIAPGESIKVAYSYELISDSVVEIDVTDLDGGGVGVIYDING